MTTFNSVPPYTTKTPGILGSDSGQIKIDAGVTFDYPLLNLLDLYIFQGKDLDKNKAEYLEEILKHPSVDGDNFKAWAALDRFTKFMRGRTK